MVSLTSKPVTSFYSHCCCSKVWWPNLQVLDWELTEFQIAALPCAVSFLLKCHLVMPLTGTWPQIIETLPFTHLPSPHIRFRPEKAGNTGIYLWEWGQWMPTTCHLSILLVVSFWVNLIISCASIFFNCQNGGVGVAIRMRLELAYQ